MEQSAALNELESEVTCPLCHGIFTEPRKLSCDHVYCRQCLHGLALRSITGSISCPECRTDTPVPPNFDVTQFATPHQVNRLVEMYQRSLKRAKTEAETQPATCNEHKSQPLALYCETCESLVCRDCVIDSCSKKSHEFEYVDNLVKKHEADFNKKLEPVQTLHQKMSIALSVISTAETELVKNEESKLQQVELTFDALTKLLAHERCYFTESIKKSFQEQKTTVAAKKEEISEVLGKLDSVVKSAESAFRARPNLALLEIGDQDHRDIVQQASSISTGPAVAPEMEVKLTSPEQFLEQWRANNFVYKMEDPLKSHLHGHYLELDVSINQTSTYTFCIDPQAIQEQVSFTASLLCCRDSTSEAVAVEKITPEQYSLSFIPQKRGRHELHVMYNDTHICGSPIPVYVTIPPQQLEAIATVEIENSGSVKCFEGKIYLSSRSAGGIVVLDSLTRLVERVIELPGVNEVLVTQEYIFATDDYRHRVVKIDRNGVIIKSVGEEGTNPGDFGYPNGIRQNKDGEIYVCDSYNCRVQVFDENLNLLRVIGEAGMANGCFESPDDLDFDEAGNIYVAEQYNHRIQVLTPEGQHIRYIGRPGVNPGPGELDHPVSPAIHRNRIYVTEIKVQRVSVFTLTGELVTTFGHDLSLPYCLTIDEDGYIYVTSNEKTLTVF